MEKKEYVQTTSVFGQGGLVLNEIIWRGTIHYPIERLLHVCTCIDNGKEVLRHAVLIGGKQKYLYQDHDKWYVKIPEKTGGKQVNEI